MTLEKRYEISAFLIAGLPKTEIAAKIVKDKNVIYREIKRNADEWKHKY